MKCVNASTEVLMGIMPSLYRHYYSFWEDPVQLTTCDVDCRKSVLCGICSGDKTDMEPCHRIEDQVISNATSGDIELDYLF